VDPAQFKRVCVLVGIDIAVETAEEIATSMAAELIAVFLLHLSESTDDRFTFHPALTLAASLRRIPFAVERQCSAGIRVNPWPASAFRIDKIPFFKSKQKML